MSGFAVHSRRLLFCGVAMSMVAGLTACESDAPAAEREQILGADLFQPLPAAMPGAEGDSPEQIALGRRLYFETELSLNRSQSCNSCHRVDAGLGGVDNLPTSPGAMGELGNRNSPTVFNAGYQTMQFWDGRAADLVAQAKGPILNPVEMGMPDSALVLQRLRQSPDYVDTFQTLFPGDAEPVSYENLARAIAAFERTLRTPGRFDAYLDGDAAALTPGEKEGLRVFIESQCGTCHQGPLLGGDRQMQIGIYQPYERNREDEGSGRYFFKVAQLRNIILTSPYFHDGRVPNLFEAVQLMGRLQLDRDFSDAETLSMVEFLGSLTGDALVSGERRPALDWWDPPHPEAIPATDEAGEVQRGRQLLRRTHELLDPAVGNALACTHCHQREGAKAYGMPWVGVTDRYPRYRGREGREGTLVDRINGCMERSMNGETIPPESPEMAAMIAYMAWLGEGAPEELEGTGTPSLRYPERRVDLDHGHLVYQAHCQGCHGADGKGQRGSRGYVSPPLWGDDSFNDGAGMHRVLTAAAFVHGNMPLGTPWDRPMLDEAAAYDVAGYMNNQPRPHMQGLERDYPDLVQKPIDSPYGPYADDFPREQHRFGPFGPIAAHYEALKAAGTKVPNPNRAGAR